MNSLSALVDILIAVFILHEIGWIDISLQEPIFYRGGDSAIERSSEGMEGITEGFQGEIFTEGGQGGTEE
ncbi:MAG: hypothetical protein AAGA75_17515 [Cyanobacteria bacterium P01_E01_bin.6]